MGRFSRMLAILGIFCLTSNTLRALEGAVVIANPSVSATRLTPEAMRDILTGKTRYWEDGQAIVIVVMAGKEQEAALKELSGMDAGQFKTFWQRVVFSGRGQQPKKAEDAASLVALVASTKGAIAIAPAGIATNGANVVQIK